MDSDFDAVSHKQLWVSEASDVIVVFIIITFFFFFNHKALMLHHAEKRVTISIWCNKWVQRQV